MTFWDHASELVDDHESPYPRERALRQPAMLNTSSDAVAALEFVKETPLGVH